MSVHDRVAAHLLAIQDKAAKLIELRTRLQDAAGGQDLMFLDPADRFDSCILGLSMAGGIWRIVYNKPAVVFALAEAGDIPPSLALEVLEGSIFQQLSGLHGQPLFMTELVDVLNSQK